MILNRVHNVISERVAYWSNVDVIHIGLDVAATGIPPQSIQCLDAARPRKVLYGYTRRQTTTCMNGSEG